MKPSTSFKAPHASPRRRVAGFSLIELMVGAAVGLLATLVIAEVLKNSEGYKRSATSGSDAQINGGLSMYAVQRQLKMAGYGLSTDGNTLGCTLSSSNAAAALPATLAPAIITAGASGASDSVRILASSKTSFALPTQVVAPYYDPADSSSDKARRFAVASSLGASLNDLMALVYGVDGACQVFQVSAAPTVGQIDRVDGGAWNTVRFPDTAAAAGAFLVNLGTLSDIQFSVTADFKLRQTQVNHMTGASTSTDLQSNVMLLKVLYGKDTNGDDIVDTYNTTTPTNNGGWLQVRAIRLAILARSAQYEKEEVTSEVPKWDVGSVGTVAGSAACGTSKCIDLAVDKLDTDWKHYRYKVFDALVPLRNQVWRADFSTATLPAPAP